MYRKHPYQADTVVEAVLINLHKDIDFSSLGAMHGVSEETCTRWSNVVLKQIYQQHPFIIQQRELHTEGGKQGKLFFYDFQGISMIS